MEDKWNLHKAAGKVSDSSVKLYLSTDLCLNFVTFLFKDLVDWVPVLQRTPFWKTPLKYGIFESVALTGQQKKIYLTCTTTVTQIMVEFISWLTFIPR